MTTPMRMIHAFAPLARSLDQNGKAFLDARLPQIVDQALRAKRAVEGEVVFGQLRRDDARTGDGRVGA